MKTIRIEILDRIDSLTETIKEHYEKTILIPMHNYGDGYVSFVPTSVVHAYLIDSLGRQKLLDDMSFLTREELKTCGHVLEKTLNDRLKDEGAPFTMLVKCSTSRFLMRDIFCYKLDYSEYTGTEDIDLLNI